MDPPASLRQGHEDHRQARPGRGGQGAARQGRQGLALVALACACSSTPGPGAPAGAGGTLIIDAGDFAEASDLALLPGGDRVIAVDFAGALALGDRKLDGAGPSDGLVARVDAAGRVRWLLPLAGPDVEAIAAVAPAGDDGSVVITGMHGPGARLGDRTLGPAGAFVARIDARGAIAALAELGGEVWLADVATGADGSLCTAGWFAGELQERDGVALHSAGSHDILVACFAASGVLVWARRAGGIAADHGTAIAIAGNRVVAAGGFSRAADFDGVELLSERGHPDGFVASWTLAGGDPIWRVRFGGRDRDAAAAVAIAADGTTWVTGTFTSAALFGSIPLASANEAAFIAAIDADGELVRARTVVAGSADATALALTPEGPIVAGSFTGDVDAEGRPLRAAGGRDIYVVAMDPAGLPRWARRLGGHDQDAAAALAATTNTLAIAGSFVDDLDLAGTPLRATGQAAFFSPL